MPNPTPDPTPDQADADPNPNPNPNPPPTPLPGDLGIIVNFPYPTNGQDKRTINAGPGKTTVRIRVPRDLDLSRHNPSTTGFARLAEAPGTTTLNRGLAARVNGVLVFNESAEIMGSAPSLSTTLNNPNGYRAVGASVNYQPGDELLFTVDNTGLESTPYTTAPFNFDFATPTRTEG